MHKFGTIVGQKLEQETLSCSCPCTSITISK